MSALALMLVAIVVVVVAYPTWGRYVARQLGIDDTRPTPAHTRADGVDFVASPAPMVLGHHFASIAGAGPIVGPILAVAFGWLPAVIWILVGIVFFGGVHDLGALAASLRHDGNSIGDVIDRYMGAGARRLFLMFAIAALVLVVAVFTDVVARTFVANGEVASTSTFFVALAVAFGVAHRALRPSLAISSVSGVGALLLCMWLGHQLPMPDVPYGAWVAILLAYVFVAAVAPVWILLQPRDYLNSFLLYGMIGGGVLGLVIARPTLELPAYVGMTDERLGFLFPVLFVTVACGAISGFHSLVASGTTSKQLAREAHARPVAYGGMLLEGLLAILAVIAAAQLDLGAYRASLGDGGPITIFATGVGGLVARLGVPMDVAVTFVSLSVAAFALTSLDTCTRLARFLVTELAGSLAGAGGTPSGGRGQRLAGTAVVVAAGGALCVSGQFTAVWPVFGAANQLLAALALLAVGTWLAHARRRNLFVMVPAAFMFAVTLAALGQLIVRNLSPGGSPVLAGVAVWLLVLALVLIGRALPSLRGVSPSTSDAAG